MKQTTFVFTADDGAILPAILWLPDQEPTMILQIIHGVGDYTGRYESLAKAMTDHGIAVTGFDLRGHGENPGSCADLGPNGWEMAISDLHRFHILLRDRFPTLPYHLMGFSLGSFLLQDYLSRYSAGINGTILVGTGWQSPALLRSVLALIRLALPLNPPQCFINFIRGIVFGACNLKFRPCRTQFDWFCSDKTQLRAFLADSHCRHDYSLRIFNDLLGGMLLCSCSNLHASWASEIPVLMLTGTDDPVGNFGNGVPRLAARMADCGVKRIKVKTLPGVRHDLFHEEASGMAPKIMDFVARWMADPSVT